MAGNLTDAAENAVLNWLSGNTTTAPVGPLRAALVTAAGTDGAPGTELAGGGYNRQTVTLTAAPGPISNTTLLRWSNLPAATVVGVEVWDSAGTPVRWWYGPLAVSRTVSAGDALEFAVGALTLALD
ncbi:hypothetical protein Lfu02_79870 [Longispora fulva]|uniref:Uncharacterized protein n=1 Tax=Longispora fulva TaxID=619741 RepID=A0A8J7GNL2_9ACTN|nr:hypothetical protein [Longispora fulva]MBG6141130.1 hypothetical protein [Longispora fulva]GIG63615.1 hypothetical protein Lfu02_79870 [Longispora fulva]